MLKKQKAAPPAMEKTAKHSDLIQKYHTWRGLTTNLMLKLCRITEALLVGLPWRWCHRVVDRCLIVRERIAEGGAR